MSSGTTGTCNYTVQSGDISGDLTVNSITGTVADAAGNALSTPATPTTNLAANKALVIDTTAPSLTFTNDVSATQTASDTIVLTASDSGSGLNVLEYGFVASTCDGTATFGNPFTSGGSFNITSNTHNGEYICAKATDNAGNITYTRSANTLNINSGITPSVVSVNRVHANPTTAASVDYTVTFSESVTGVDTTDFSLTTSGTSGSVASVSGSGETYTVTINSITGDGTIRLDVLDDNSIINGASNPLSAGFASGQTYTVDNTLPTVTNVTSDKANGSYTVGEVIDIDVTFSEAVTSTGNVTVTLETGTTDRTCTFTVSSGTTGTCNYTVQSGDISGDLTVNSITGTVADAAGNALSTPATPTTNLAANKALVIDTT